MDNTILYEDNHLIVVIKKPGDISQSDKTGDVSLGEKISGYLKERYNKPGNVYLGLVHRLDRPVSGVMVFAKTSKAAARLQQSIKQKTFKKIYWAVVKNAPPQTSGTLLHYLLKNETKNKSFVSDAAKKGAKQAVLNYTLIGSSLNYHLLQIELETGRHHQIRAQLAAIHCPVKGDLKYGYARSNPDGSIHLHAFSLTFKHPVKEEILHFETLPGDDSVWNAFKQMHPST